MDTGNPWVDLNLPVPVPAYTRTREWRVRVLTGFPKGTGTGTLPMGMGTEIDTEKLKSYVTKYLSIQIKKNLPQIIKNSLTMRDKQGFYPCLYPLWRDGFDGYGYGYAQGYKKFYPYPYPSYPYPRTRRVNPYPCQSLVPFTQRAYTMTDIPFLIPSRATV